MEDGSTQPPATVEVVVKGHSVMVAMMAVETTSHGWRLMVRVVAVVQLVTVSVTVAA